MANGDTIRKSGSRRKDLRVCSSGFLPAKSLWTAHLPQLKVTASVRESSLCDSSLPGRPVAAFGNCLQGECQVGEKEISLSETREGVPVVAQLVKRPTVDFGSGHDLKVCDLARSQALRCQHRACLGCSLSLSLCASPLVHALSLSLSQNKEKKLKEREREREVRESSLLVLSLRSQWLWESRGPPHALGEAMWVSRRLALSPAIQTDECAVIEAFIYSREWRSG